MRKTTCARCSGSRLPTSSYCRKHRNAYQNAYYKKHPQSASKSSVRRRKLIRDTIIKAKNVPCKDCKKRYPYYVMDLDHVRGKKVFHLSVAASKMRGLSLVEKEITKCEVVCANCHRERTFSRSGVV